MEGKIIIRLDFKIIKVSYGRGGTRERDKVEAETERELEMKQSE